MMVAAVAIPYSPAPAGIPTAAFTQIVAAVVIPWTLLPLLRIDPAPRKPMPLTICAAMRSGVPPARASSMDTTVNKAEPTAMSMFVRRPAAFCRSSRSTPMAAPRPAASRRRSIKSIGGMSLADRKAQRDTVPARRAHALDADRTAAHLLGARSGFQDRRRIHPHPAGDRAGPVHREPGQRSQNVG